MGDENRRRHQRLELTEDAIAIDAQQRELGRVVRAGGGGFTLETKDENAAAGLKVGEVLEITILEPRSQTRNTIDVVVRYQSGRQFGLEFVTGNSV
jgi:hypothetical protein